MKGLGIGGMKGDGENLKSKKKRQPVYFLWGWREGERKDSGMGGWKEVGRGKMTTPKGEQQKKEGGGFNRVRRKHR